MDLTSVAYSSGNVIKMLLGISMPPTYNWWWFWRKVEGKFFLRRMKQTHNSSKKWKRLSIHLVSLLCF